MKTALSLAALALVACSAPFYAAKPLTAVDPEDEGLSLVFGSVEIVHAAFSFADSEPSEVEFRRLAPYGRELYYMVSDKRLFQAFHPRQVKNGYFIAYLPPGAYELDYLAGTRTTWNISDESSVHSRFYVTRPGIYDIGIIRLTEPYPFLPTFNLEFVPPPATRERREVLRAAVAGTRWAEVLAERL